MGDEHVRDFLMKVMGNGPDWSIKYGVMPLLSPAFQVDCPGCELPIRAGQKFAVIKELHTPRSHWHDIYLVSLEGSNPCQY